MAIASAHAATNTQPMDEVLGAYLKIQESLAKDSMDGVTASATLIAGKSADDAIKTPAQALSKDTAIEPARENFKKLSTAMDEWAKVKKPSGVDRAYCHMASAPWLQKTGDIHNPYYGKSMESCGEIRK